jgi:Fur family zinc uptake transcriptional regulator
MTEPVAFRVHDHDGCRREALAAVEERCAARGLRLTPMRRRVLEILLEDHSALGAYDVLRRLTDEGGAPQPPVAYRALDFLVANGFAHRIEKKNAYVACTTPGSGHRAAFLICRRCGAVAELDASAATPMLEASAEGTGFAIDRAVIEIEGLCAACQAAA